MYLSFSEVNLHTIFFYNKADDLVIIHPISIPPPDHFLYPHAVQCAVITPIHQRVSEDNGNSRGVGYSNQCQVTLVQCMTTVHCSVCCVHCQMCSVQGKLYWGIGRVSLLMTFVDLDDLLDKWPSHQPTINTVAEQGWYTHLDSRKCLPNKKVQNRNVTYKKKTQKTDKNDQQFFGW